MSSLLLLAGCGSSPQNLRVQFPAVPPKLQVVEADARSAFFAAQLAFKRLDFDLTRTSVTGYRVEAARGGDADRAFADSRRFEAYLGVEEVGRNRSEVSLRLIAVVEGRGLAGSTEVALPEHEFYGRYFSVLQEVLAEKAAGVPPR